MIQSVILDLKNNVNLSVENAEEILEIIFKENISDLEILEFLVALTDKGETVNEIVGFAKAMRKNMLKVPLKKYCSGKIIDVCGTGGVTKDRFNLSTASAFVLASLGVKVAKHGNYGSKKLNGSFNFLEALQIPFNLPIEHLEEQFKEMGLCFLFARLFHPAMKKVANARKEIGKRTIFNLLGPLCNPAEVSHQIIGCTNQEIGEKLAAALQALENERAFVVVGADGLDELEVAPGNLIYDINSEKITTVQVDGSQFVNYSDKVIADYSDSGKNAFFFELLIDAPGLYAYHPVMALMKLNAAAALLCLGEVETIEAGVLKAENIIQSGELAEFIHRFKNLEFN